MVQQADRSFRVHPGHLIHVGDDQAKDGLATSLSVRDHCLLRGGQHLTVEEVDILVIVIRHETLQPHVHLDALPDLHVHVADCLGLEERRGLSVRGQEDVVHVGRVADQLLAQRAPHLLQPLPSGMHGRVRRVLVQGPVRLRHALAQGRREGQRLRRCRGSGEDLPLNEAGLRRQGMIIGLLNPVAPVVLRHALVVRECVALRTQVALQRRPGDLLEPGHLLHERGEGLHGHVFRHSRLDQACCNSDALANEGLTAQGAVFLPVPLGHLLMKYQVEAVHLVVEHLQI
mmetsp:Transcript_55476/g.129406  ORF Transcript_55476/g.129406 Transcript_55476/m.129406 type:complete len:287 (+) Transcript_55476:2131-2991(+)